jgi:hypothetical protein
MPIPSAPTQIVTESIVGPYTLTPVPAGDLNITWTQADPVNGNFFYFDNPSGDILLAWNTDYGVVHTLTIFSQPDVPFDRTGDITEYEISAGSIAAYNLSQAVGWGIVVGPTPTSYQIDIQADSDTVWFAVIQR